MSTNAVSIALIAAVSENGVIGVDGEMPWRLSEDLKWFKKNTLAKPVIMGRKTYQSIGKPLPGRTNIIITRDEDFAADDVLIVRTIESAIETGKRVAIKDNVEEICIIGGGEIYAQTLSLASRLYLTRVMSRLEGDTYFPDIDSDNWDISRHGVVMIDAKNSHPCEFFIFERRPEG